MLIFASTTPSLFPSSPLTDCALSALHAKQPAARSSTPTAPLHHHRRQGCCWVAAWWLLNYSPVSRQLRWVYERMFPIKVNRKARVQVVVLPCIPYVSCGFFVLLSVLSILNVWGVNVTVFLVKVRPV